MTPLVIIPSSLTSAFAADTKVSDLDCTDAFRLCAQSLTARGKSLAPQTYARKLKRDYWTQHLFSRTFALSPGANSLRSWLEEFCPLDGHASQSATQESEKQPRTSDGSSTSSQMALVSCDPDGSSLKTWKDCCLLECPTDQASSDTASRDWKDYITKLRQAYSARVKSARHTRGKGSLSWPTATSQDGKQGGITPYQAKGGNHTNLLHVAAINEEERNWPSPVASEVRQGFQDRSKGMKGSQESLTTVVMKGWPTPNASDSLQGGTTQGNRKDPNLSIAVHGQAAPASSSTHGSRQGLWPTITAHTPDMESNGPNGHSGTYLAGAVKQWATPRSGKTTDENPETWALRQARGDVATMPLTAQVKCWATPKASDPQHSGPNMRDSAGNYALPAQAVRAQLGTPTARDHKSGRGNEEREYKELTPMVERQQSGKLNPRWVETLMGLPIGWTMPSCTSPVTIAPTSCDSSATALCRPAQSERSDFLLAS